MKDVEFAWVKYVKKCGKPADMTLGHAFYTDMIDSLKQQKEKIAAVQIQSAGRGFKWRKWLAAIKRQQRDEDATIIQAAARARLSGLSTEERQQALVASMLAHAQAESALLGTGDDLAAEVERVITHGGGAVEAPAVVRSVASTGSQGITRGDTTSRRSSSRLGLESQNRPVSRGAILGNGSFSFAPYRPVQDHTSVNPDARAFTEMIKMHGGAHDPYAAGKALVPFVDGSDRTNSFVYQNGQYYRQIQGR